MLRALVVDDHPGIAQAVAAMVRTSGCEAAIVHNARAAMDFLRSHHADLVVLDVSMPGMSGLEVLREMGAEGMLPGTPVLMFSASEEHRERSLMLGPTGFVLKHEADDLAGADRAAVTLHQDAARRPRPIRRSTSRRGSLTLCPWNPPAARHAEAARPPMTTASRRTLIKHRGVSEELVDAAPSVQCVAPGERGRVERPSPAGRALRDRRTFE